MQPHDTCANRTRPFTFNGRNDQLQWLELSFTGTGFAALKAYRVQLSKKSGGPVSLGQSLDALIKSHPFVTGHEAPHA
jgi:hypothetical protein